MRRAVSDRLGGAWTAPAAAGAFAAGIALATAAGWGPSPGWAALLAGAATVAVAAVRSGAGPRARAGATPLLDRAGLLPVTPPPDERERILAAARAAAGGADGADAPVGEAQGPVPGRVRRRGSWGVRAAALAGTVVLGAGWAGVRAANVDRSYLTSLAGRSVILMATLGDEPRDGPFGWSAQATVREVVAADARVALRESVWLQGRGRAPPLRTGDRVRLMGRASVPERGGFGDYLRGRGIAVILSVESVERLGGPRNPLLSLADATRRALRRGIERAFPPRAGGLLLGLATGDTSMLDPTVEEDFRASGLGHLLAVSGSNVALFLAPVLGLALALRLGVRGRAALAAVALAFFVVLTRAEPSVLRAAAMTGIALWGGVLGRRRSGAALLGTAILVLLAWDPALLGSVGFQLSVAATAGILALAGPIQRRLRLPPALGVAAGATIGAQVAVTPLLLFHFHVAPTASLPANLLAFAAVGPALLLGLTAAAVGLVWPAAGAVLAWPARLPLGWLIAVADRSATAPLPSITGGGAGVLVAGTAVVAWLAWRLRTGRRLSPRFGIVLVAGPLLVWTLAVRAGPPGLLTVRFLDVGQGDATLVQSPAGAAVLVDAGPDPHDVAVRLAALGVRRLDVVVATHAHADHVGGLPAVLARFPVGVVLDPGCPADSPAYDDFLRAVRDEDVPTRRPVPGEAIRVGDLLLEVLGPPGCYVGTESDANNASIVLRLSRGHASVLLTGDAEEPAQEDLLASVAGSLEAVVLKVPHHGGGTSLGEFLVASRAAVAVVSVGAGNDYGHPVPWVIATLRAAGARIYRTDRQGEVVVRFGPEGLLVESERAA